MRFLCKHFVLMNLMIIVHNAPLLKIITINLATEFYVVCIINIKNIQGKLVQLIFGHLYDVAVYMRKSLQLLWAIFVLFFHAGINIGFRGRSLLTPIYMMSEPVEFFEKCSNYFLPDCACHYYVMPLNFQESGL